MNEFWRHLLLAAFPGLLMLWIAICYRLYLYVKYWRPPMSAEEKASLLAALTRRSFVADIWRNNDQI